MQLSKDRIGGLLLLLFCLFYGWKIGDIPLLPFQANQAFTPRTIPQVLAVFGTALSIAVILFPGSRETIHLKSLNWPLGLAFLVLMSAYGLLVRPAGFLISTSLFLIIGFAMLGERKLINMVLVAVPLVVAFWALMTFGLSVYIAPLPAFLGR